MAAVPHEPDLQEEHEGAASLAEREVTRPPDYKVLLHNDDYTTMDFVVRVLKEVFGKAEEEAIRIMLHVHHRGVGVAGVYTYEVAETKVARVTHLSRQSEYPLLCTLEKDT
jgi:ATP-dependent Clp protease adaptor protein ClpS